MFKVARPALVIGLLVSASRGEVLIAPQDFHQEIARHREGTNGLGSGAVKLVMTISGQACVLIGDRWFSRNGDGWSEGRVDAFPEGIEEVIQAIAVGKTNYLATARDVFVQ